MLTTLTLDDDVATRLTAEARRTGLPLNDLVNAYLRLALGQRRKGFRLPPFEIRPRDLGSIRPGLNLDNVGDLLGVAEGPLHR